jgi:hypothetical protein
MFKRVWLWVLSLLRRRSQAPELGADRTTQYSLRVFESRQAARDAAETRGLAALVSAAGNDKWLILKCPCGCRQELALNLMSSHLPRWRVEAAPSGRFNVHPSVDATSCGAHFWIRGGQVNWCD